MASNTSCDAKTMKGRIMAVQLRAVVAVEEVLAVGLDGWDIIVAGGIGGAG